jgi:hypothetical protein
MCPRENRSAGRYRLTWNAANLPSGMYFLQMSVDGKPVSSKKMMLVK